MRMSCNGCRVLRKGCSDDCSIRPCLQWIKNPESQANATVFLAKFYGRAGLLNLINAGPDNLRPAIFRSLLYEACGRIVNPIYGSVGLLWSDSWQTCQAAVEAVLSGKPIAQTTPSSSSPPALNPYDIRHVAAAADLHRPAKASRTRFKKSAQPRAARPELRRADSHESSENESGLFSAEASHVSQAEPSSREEEKEEESGVELDLTLGFDSVKPAAVRAEAERTRVGRSDGWDDDTCEVELGL
ncbi:LOB domain-containing protein 41-like [Iris pallida]|uniref:LOB domain-containing protein 41-like n=1 Tax=Iris pallida TaxID=29817 RepID=A0AAX6EH53_IRIPA|nr:LOB domain-containing protein 41-like [Iris pallida]